MSTSTKKHISRPKKVAGAAAKPSRSSAETSKATKVGSESKQARVVAMLRSPAGTTIAAMMRATGWQQHSVRGFLAGVVRKRLKLKLDSTKVDGTWVYRLATKAASTAAIHQPTRRSR